VGGKDYSFGRDDQAKVHLGYDEKLVPVFSGLVDNVEYGIATVKMTALGLAVDLLRLRLYRVYSNQTAGDIVSDLAQEVGLKVKEASEGISFPMYVVDYAANAYEHILKLAERCNFDAYITDDEKLVFKEWNGGKKHSLEYGKDIIGIEELDFSPVYVGTRIYGESPSSVKGSDTYHWLTKQEIKGEAGSGAALSIHDPAIKDKETAETVAKARLNKLKYTLVAVVETVGKPEIMLGDTVAVEGMPTAALTGELDVRGVEHYLSKVKGFTTRICCWMKGDAG
jgi:phage protein D